MTRRVSIFKSAGAFALTAFAVCAACLTTPSPLRAAEPPATSNYVGLGDGVFGDSVDCPTFADMIRTFRVMTKNAGSTQSDDCPRDSAGWPTQDCYMYLSDGSFIHSGNGTYLITFNGQATIAAAGGTVQNQTYNSSTNTTTANIVCSVTSGVNSLTLTNTIRTSSSGTNTGVTNLSLMRPITPGSTTSYAAGTLFTNQTIANFQRFNVIRFMDYYQTNGNPEIAWTDRVPASSVSWEDYPQFWTSTGAHTKGHPWEGAIALANATNCDMYINIPAQATDDYVTKLAQMIRYGSDGTNPYTTTQGSPVWAPLNSNLKCYVEYANELWNTSYAFQQSFQNHDLAVAEVNAGGSPLNYDGLVDSSGWGYAYRRNGNRSVAISNLFRAVWGDSNMPGTSANPRIRPIIEWQYGDGNGTGSSALMFVDNYYNNADGLTHVATPHPISYYYWGGGTAAYYNPVNNDSDTLTVDEIFSEADVSQRPAQWTYQFEDIKWTSMYGIKRIAYEGGLGLGDNTTHSLTAKQQALLDPRIQTLEITNQDIWSNNGGDLLMYFESGNDLGYGFTDNNFSTSTQKLQGISQITGRTKAAVTVGIALPATLTPSQAGVSWYTSGGGSQMPSSPNHAFNIWSPLRVTADATFTFTPTLSTTVTGTMQLWVDGVLQSTFAVPNTGGVNQALTGVNVALTASRLHGCKLVMTSGTCSLLQLAVSENGVPQPPGPPANVVATVGDTQIGLTWNASSGATSYNVKRTTVSGSGYVTVNSPAGLSFTNTGLTDGTLYYYVVTAVNTGGESGNSSEVSGTPFSLSSFNGQAAFASTAPVIDGNNSDAVWSAATSYNITNLNGTLPTGHAFSASYKSAWDNNNLYVLVDVTDDTLFKYVTNAYEGDSVEVFVDADNSKGAVFDANDYQYIFPWNSTTITEIKRSPGSLTGVTFGQVNTTGGYRIEAKIPWSTLGVSPAANNLVGVDLHVDNADTTAGTRDCLLMWHDTNNTAWSTPAVFGSVKLMPGSGGVPAAPTGLAATAGNAQAALSWTASSGATSYNVLRSTVSGSGYASVATGVATTSYTNTGLTNGTTYYFVVTATNASGTSGNSNQTSATPAATAGLIAYNGFNGAPTGWTSFTYSPNHSTAATGLTYTGLPVVGNAIKATSKISAGDNSVGLLPSVQQTGVVYVSYLVNLGTIVTADSPSTYLWFFNGATEQWRVGSVPWASPAYAFGFFDAASNTQTWSSTVPASNTTYFLVAKADFTNGNLKVYVNPSATGSEPGTASATLAVTAAQMAFDRVKVALENNTSATIDEVRVGTTWASVTAGASPPAAPTGLTATAGNTQVALSWTASSGATSYNALRSTVSGSGYASVATGIATTNYTNTGLTNGTTYYFVVQAVNANGTSPNSAQASATPQVAAPAAPTGLTATPGNTQVALSWTASSGATAYDVKRSTVSGSGYATVSSPTVTNYTNTGLTNGTTYYFVVDAKNAGGTSGNSNQASTVPTSGLIAYNGFDGSPTGWTSFTYSTHHSITAAALTYTGLPVVGNAIAATSKISATDNSAGILPSVQQTGVVYISYLVNLGTIVTGDSPSTFLWFYNGSTEQWRVGSVPWASPAYAFGFFDAASNTQTWSSTAAASNTTYLLVAKADFTNGNLKLFVNPTVPGSEPGTANATLAVTAAQMAFDRVKVALENNTSARIDEVRVGPTWASVTP